MPDSRNHHDVRVLFHADTSYGSERIVGSFVEIVTDEAGVELVRNINSGFEAYRNEFAELHIEAYVGNDDTDSLSQADGTWGWTCSYKEPFRVDINVAKAMVKQLTKLERGHAKLYEEWGPCETFGNYIIRCCRILGVTKIGNRVGPTHSWHDQNEYVWFTASHAPEVVYRFVRELRPEKVEA